MIKTEDIKRLIMENEDLKESAEELVNRRDTSLELVSLIHEIEEHQRDNVMLNFEVEDLANESNNYLIATTNQEVKKGRSLPIIWDYDFQTDYENIDEICEVLAKTHNDIETLFKK